MFVSDYVQDTITRNVYLDYKKGKLKKTTKKYSFILFFILPMSSLSFIMNKKVIDSQATFESVLRGIKKSFNIPYIARETTNIFVNIDYEEEQVYYHENGNKISLVSKITVKPNFLEFIMTQDKEMHAFFTNRLHSQEMINEMIAEKIQQYYHSEKMIEFIIQFMTNTFYTNFVQILNQGQKILFNVDPKKSSKGSKYHVVEDLEKFELDTKSSYRILQEFQKKSEYLDDVWMYRDQFYTIPQKEWIKIKNNDVQTNKKFPFIFYKTNNTYFYYKKEHYESNKYIKSKYFPVFTCIGTTAITMNKYGYGGGMHSFPNQIQKADNTLKSYYLLEEFTN